MPILDIAALKTLPPVKAHQVSVPELGGEVYVAELTADEKDLRIEIGWDEHKKARDLERKRAGLLNGSGQLSTVDETNVGMTSWIAAACLCDENRVFCCKDLIEISKTCEEFEQLRSAVIARIAVKAQEVNAISPAVLEAIEKN